MGCCMAIESQQESLLANGKACLEKGDLNGAKKYFGKALQLAEQNTAEIGVVEEPESPLSPGGTVRFTATAVPSSPGVHTTRSKQAWTRRESVLPSGLQDVGLSTSNSNPFVPRGEQSVSIVSPNANSKKDFPSAASPPALSRKLSRRRMSSVFSNVETEYFEIAMATLRLRLQMGVAYLDHDFDKPAEEHFGIVQRGASYLAAKTKTSLQSFEADNLWAQVSVGICTLSMKEARELGITTQPAHDQTCLYAIHQCRLVREWCYQSAINKHAPESATLIDSLKIEAVAHAERRDYRNAVLRVQKASGLATKLYGLESPKYKAIQEMITEYKKKSSEVAPSERSPSLYHASLDDVDEFSFLEAKEKEAATDADTDELL